MTSHPPATSPRKHGTGPPLAPYRRHVFARQIVRPDEVTGFARERTRRAMAPQQFDRGGHRRRRCPRHHIDRGGDMGRHGKLHSQVYGIDAGVGTGNIRTLPIHGDILPCNQVGPLQAPSGTNIRVRDKLPAS